jgi:hypothetical protein
MTQGSISGMRPTQAHGGHTLACFGQVSHQVEAKAEIRWMRTGQNLRMLLSAMRLNESKRELLSAMRLNESKKVQL